MVQNILVMILWLSLLGWVSLADTAVWAITNGWVDQWLVVSLACDPSSVTNGTVNVTTCVITCDSGYTKSGNVCNANATSPSWWWGRGGGGWYTPAATGTTSEDTTGEETVVDETTQTNEESTTEWETEGTEALTYDQETQDAYDYAFEHNITTLLSVEWAMPFGSLYRRDAAKMIVNFASSVGRNTVVHETCEFQDIADVEQDLQNYIVDACRLGFMGLRGDGTVAPWFRPHDTLTRAEFGALLSRMLRWNTYNSVDPNAEDRYVGHLQALQDAGIMHYIENPSAVERRVYAWIVFMRLSDMTIDLGITTDDVVEQETGDVVEQETGDVIEQETGDVIEQETGDVIEQETGDVVEQETGDVVEQESTPMGNGVSSIN